MAKAKIERTQNLFLKAIGEKFMQTCPGGMSTVFERKGLGTVPVRWSS